MAIHGMKKTMVECMSWRECSFYIEYLNSLGMQNYKFQDLYNYPNISRCSDDIQTGVMQEHQNNAEKQIKEMKQLYKKSQLSSSDFSFFDAKQKRACNWAWLFLKKQTLRFDNKRFDTFPFEGRNRCVSMRSYNNHRLRLDSKSLEKHPCNTDERVSAIKNAFIFSEVDKEGQIEIIELMQHVWAGIYQKKSIGNWIDREDSVQCDWVWDYIQSSAHSRYFQAWPPINNDEKYFAIQVIFDHGSWEYPDKITLLINSMKKAWSQKKFRDKSEGKKPYSITMTAKTKNRLDDLVLRQELKITEIMENLIRAEHEKECSKAAC